MKSRQVRFSPEARDDLLALYDWIAAAAGAAVALGYVERIEAFCGRLDLASARGVARDDIRPGLRVIGYERRVSVAFVVNEETVIVLRVFYGGQDWEGKLG